MSSAASVQPKLTLSLVSLKEIDKKLQYENALYLNPEDLAALGLKDNDCVCVEEILVHRVRGDGRVPQGTLGSTSLNWQSLHLKPETAVGKLVRVEPWESARHNNGLEAHGISLVVDLYGRNKTELQVEDLERYIRDRFHRQVFCKDQRWIISVEVAGGTRWLSLRVASIRAPDIGGHKSKTATAAAEGSTTERPSRKTALRECQCAVLNKDGSVVTLMAASNPYLKLVQPTGSIRAFGPSWDPESLGIGGLQTQFSTIFRRAFASRMYPAEVVREMGVKHVKGMLLYGPPGTGKTLIARSIGGMLTEREPKVVNGPEILNKYVGQSEENIRELFQDAREDEDANGDKAGLHIIIFDEIDAICKVRGSTGSGAGAGVHDTVVNQLLSMVDGVKALNNILVIGMTNRKDLIDSALLRSGRLEVHIEIGLPDEGGREQIFRIHTKQLREHGRLDEEISLAELAKRTKNYTGAEIEGVVRSAISFAMQQNIDVDNLEMVSKEKLHAIKITKEFFEMALAEVRCEFGADEDLALKFGTADVVEFNADVCSLMEEVSRMAHSLKEASGGPQLSRYTILLKGPHGSGKSALATHLALKSKFPFVRVLSTDDMVAASDFSVCQRIARVFDDAYKSELSVVIIDDFERLIGHSVGLRFRESIFNTLLACVRRSPFEQRKILIIATCVGKVCDALELHEFFDAVRRMPLVGSAEQCATVLRQSTANCAPSVEAVAARFPPLSAAFRGIGIGSLMKVLVLAVDRDSLQITPDSFEAAIYSKLGLVTDDLIASGF